MNFIAHIRESDHQIQTVEEHLLGVKHLAEVYGDKLGVKHIAGLAGMLHDMGKYSTEFRNYILEAVKNPDDPPKRGSVDHSTAGGKLLYQMFHTGKPSVYKGLLAEIVGNAVISHHSYLHDYLNPELSSDYLRRVRDKEVKEYEEIKQRFFASVISESDFHDYVERAADELKEFLEKKSAHTTESKLMFLTKFIFSVLIDADRTDTRSFEAGETIELDQEQKQLFSTYYQRLLEKIGSFPNRTPIESLRREMSDQCDAFAEKPSGLYTLSIPTGGGKTLASLRYALKHALHYNKKRIIYVVPYTTIIEQNANAVRSILQDEDQILEHHSNVIADLDDDDEWADGVMSARQKLKLAKDNWDAPIIFTTMVQFLNVFFAKGSRNIRRLHNVVDSVIIFDEIQKLPVPCISLFNQTVNFLKTYGNASLVLCTATQPALDFVEQKLEISADAEMIRNLEQVTEAFKRVEVIDQASNKTYTNEQLSEFLEMKIGEVQSVLVILNTKSVVKRLYQMVKVKHTDIPVYHLSTSMCAAHRNKILHEVRACLANGRKVICISTQLIEAGVDVSFDCVIRSLAGLDSIAQAAGRCNRHGEKEVQQVFIIDHEEEHLDSLKEIKIGKRLSKKILIDLQSDPSAHGGDILSMQAMQNYFRKFYTEFKTDVNYFIRKLGVNMTELLGASKRENRYYLEYVSRYGELPPLFLANSYKTAAEHFQVIDDQTTSVIVPYEKGKEIIADLSSAGTIDDLTRLLREAQQYSVNVYDEELRQLERHGGVLSGLDGKVLMLSEGAYNEEFGLDVGNDSFSDLIV